MIMEVEGLSQFPDELLEKVLAQLPVATLFQLRLVCKRWYTLISSERFHQLCVQMASVMPWFFIGALRSSERCGVYDPSLNKWHRTQFQSIGKGGILLPIASDGGLVCIFDMQFKKFYVGDPLGRYCCELPPRHLKGSTYAVGMVTEKCYKAFKLLLVDTCGDYELYNSASNSWTRPSCSNRQIFMPNMDCETEPDVFSKTITMNGFIYILCRSMECLLYYDIQEELWHELSVPAPHFSRHSTLLECRSCIFMVAMLENDDTNTICVWELEMSTRLWLQVDEMPDSVCPGFGTKQPYFRCLGNRDVILLCLRYIDLDGVERSLVLYDISKKSWQRLPIDILAHMPVRHRMISGVSFAPRFDTSAIESFMEEGD